MRTSPSKNHGFSLLELIAVILIIGIIAAFVTPAASTILKGSQLTQASQIVTDQIKMARQLALTKNRSVEVRLLKYADPETPGETDTAGKPDITKGHFRGIQIFEVLESGATSIPLDKPQALPMSIIMNPGTISTIIGDPEMSAKKVSAKNDSNSPPLPRLAAKSAGDPSAAKDYEYIPFRFLPDGSTNLPIASDKKWCITIHNINDYNPQAPEATRAKVQEGKINFYTLQIDPISGSTKFYRPSL